MADPALLFSRDARQLEDRCLGRAREPRCGLSRGVPIYRSVEEELIRARSAYHRLPNEALHEVPTDIEARPLRRPSAGPARPRPIALRTIRALRK
jgi:hypothetical protein